jgi:hypothetical protein
MNLLLKDENHPINLIDEEQFDEMTVHLTASHLPLYLNDQLMNDEDKDCLIPMK